MSGYSIPKETPVYANVWEVMHGEDYWTDPEVFRPDRFLTPENKFRKDERCIPFMPVSYTHLTLPTIYSV